jgi:predicted nucleotidyltransferase
VLKTVGLVEILRKALTPLHPRIRCAFIFGSFARGEQGRESDVDLMIIGEARVAEVARAQVGVQRRLGREVNPTVYRPLELASKLAEAHHFLTEVMAGPKIYLLGDDDELRTVAEAGLDSPAQDQRK